MPYALLDWLIPAAMVPVVARRHSPPAALAWLIFLFFSPRLGLCLYLIIGTNFIMRRITKSYCRRLQEIRSMEHLAVQEPHIFRMPEDPRRLELARIAQRLVCMPILRGNEVELLDDGCDFINRLVADIDGAHSHVHLLFYIFAGDEVGWRVAEALAAASRRGVVCRVLVDAFGSRGLQSTLAPWMKERGVELVEFMGINPRRWHLTRLDLRNHRKLAVIDGQLAYTGSQNIEAKDYAHARADAWHDLMVRVTGPVVLQLQLVFCEDWFLASEQVLEGAEIFPAPELPGDTPAQTMPSGPMDPEAALRDILFVAINGARERILITTPYFIPDEPFFTALRLATLRGVRVDLLIPNRADHPVVGAVARAHFDGLLAAGANIYLHKGLLHSKSMCVDDTLALVGTANFDHRSFFLHSELSLLLYGSEITSRLRMKQEEYIRQSDPVDPRRWMNRSGLRRMRDETLKLLSPLL